MLVQAVSHAQVSQAQTRFEVTGSLKASQTAPSKLPTTKPDMLRGGAPTFQVG